MSKNSDFDEQDNAIKSFFLGPQAENQVWVKEEMSRVVENWFSWRKSLFPKDGCSISQLDIDSQWFNRARQCFSESLTELINLYRDETPKFSPRYMGHMVSEISLPAILGHVVNLLHNPNLAAKDAAKVGSKLELEAIQNLLSMIGMCPLSGQGHFTSGGTIANFESIWRARYRMDHWLSFGAYLSHHGKSKDSIFSHGHMGWDSYNSETQRLGLEPNSHEEFSFVRCGPWAASRTYKKVFNTDFLGPVILVPGNKHYSWLKGASIFGMGEDSFWSVDLNSEGRLCCHDLQNKIEMARTSDRPILMLVSVAGTTEMGNFDPIDKVQDLLDQYRKKQNIHIWHHVDAAYGGFYCSLLTKSEPTHKALAPATSSALKRIRDADSVTIDPHKLGYVPYACGAILLKSREQNRVSQFSAPYLAQQPTETPWSMTLEGSRSGSGMAATWLTAKAIGFHSKGLGAILDKGLVARKRLESLLLNINDCYFIPARDSNILCFCFAKTGEALSQTNARNLKIFDHINQGNEFSISKTHLNTSEYGKLIKTIGREWQADFDAHELCLLRVVLMNPFVVSDQPKFTYLPEFVSYIKNIATSTDK